MDPKATRRGFLQHLGLAAAAASSGALFRAREARAQSAGRPPKRFVFMFTPSGTAYHHWRPRGTGPTFPLDAAVLNTSRSLAPLADFANRVLIVDNVQNAAALASRGDAHGKGMATMLTNSTYPGGEGYSATGISVDQFIADHLGLTGSHRTLQLGVRVLEGDGRTRMNYTGPRTALAAIENPYDALRAIFPFAGSGADARATRARQQAAVRFALDDLAALRTAADPGDDARIAAHVAALNAVQTDLTAPAGAGTCSAPTFGPEATADAWYRQGANFPLVGQMHTQLLVEALACGAARIATLQWGAAGNIAGGAMTMPWLHLDCPPPVGTASGRHEPSCCPPDPSDPSRPDPACAASLMGVTHHGLSHALCSGTAAQKAYALYALGEMNRWFAQQFANLLQALYDRRDSDGSRLLDNTVVVWGSEASGGGAPAQDPHVQEPIPWIIAGGGWQFRTGRYVDVQGASHGRLLLSVCHAMGVNVASFGDRRFGTGPLAALQ